MEAKDNNTPVNQAKSRKEKFSMLTLFSKKKKQKTINLSPDQDRKSAKHNLSDAHIQETTTNQIKNHLFLSDSSAIIISDDDDSDEKSVFEQHFSTPPSISNSTEMASLKFSEEDTELPADDSEKMSKQRDEIAPSVEQLSEKISLLSFNPIPTIVISSEDAITQCSQSKSPEKAGEKFSPLSSEQGSRTESPITVSDSVTSQEPEPIISCDTQSSSRPSNTFINAKADHLRIFLEDVQSTFKRHQIANADTESMSQISEQSDWQIGQLQISQSELLSKAKKLAAADTESMTLDDEFMPPAPVETTTKGQNEISPAKRLASNDTEDMTNFSFIASPLAIDHTDESIVHNSMPEDSITIPETSSEQESILCESRTSFMKNDNPQKESSKSQSSRSSFSSASSNVDLNASKINFTAKINVQIQISVPGFDTSSEEESTKDNSESKNSSEPPQDVDNHEIIINKSNSSNEKFSPPTRDIPDTNQAPLCGEKTPKQSDSEESGKFLNEAENLLNELYGNAWRTPEICHKLSSSTKKRNEKCDMATEVTLKKKDKTRKVLEDNFTVAEKKTIEIPEKSVIDDFSIFRKNIKMNFDSTRVAAGANDKKYEPTKGAVSERKLRNKKPVESSKINQAKTERKVRQRVQKETQQDVRKLDNESESEGENASDDSSSSEYHPSSRVRKAAATRRKQQKNISKNTNDIVYLDLTKDEVEIQEDISSSPPANNDKDFNAKLQKLLQNFKNEDKIKLHASPKLKTKRKLFNPMFNYDHEECEQTVETKNLNDQPESIVTPKKNDQENEVRTVETPRRKLFTPSEGIKDNLRHLNNFLSPLESLEDQENVRLNGRLPKKYQNCQNQSDDNKQLPIFKIPDIQAPVSAKRTQLKTPTTLVKSHGNIAETPDDKYSFLRSLDVCVGRSHCHPHALYYRDNYRSKREELANKLFELYNEKIFNNNLTNVQMKWNKKLLNTAGRCLNKKKMEIRSSVVELSEKVLTSADRLRCTLVHELCHAATWVFDGEGGHGATWKKWALKANTIFPDLPKITVCHQYKIEYKYTYRCTLCGASSHSHSKSKKVENIRCSFCFGPIEVFRIKKDKDGNTNLTPVREPTGFALFVKDNYHDFKRPDRKHADVIKLLSSEFAALKVEGK